MHVTWNSVYLLFLEIINNMPNKCTEYMTVMPENEKP